MAEKKRRFNRRKFIQDGSTYLILIFVAVLMFGPFLWMVLTSFKGPDEVLAYPPKFLPDPFSFESYKEIFRTIPFLNFTLNSFKISILCTIGQIISCALAAYAFARMKFKGSKVLYYILLSTMMIPSQVTMIPVFIIIRFLGLIDTHLALILPAFFGGAFGTFLLRQFFSTIPKELEEAAIIDGCGKFRIFWKIILPQAKPVLATLAIFSFMAYWNDLMGPVIYLTSMEKMTLTVGLASVQGFNFARFDLIMAGSFLSIIPILVLFMVSQKFFIKSIVVTGIKE
jgi:multiple sugar transport system permease protein